MIKKDTHPIGKLCSLMYMSNTRVAFDGIAVATFMQILSKCRNQKDKSFQDSHSLVGSKGNS